MLAALQDAGTVQATSLAALAEPQGAPVGAAGRQAQAAAARRPPVLAGQRLKLSAALPRLAAAHSACRRR